MLYVDISIHAAREGGDMSKGLKARHYAKFQSTPPVKAATPAGSSLPDRLTISIHAAREGGDTKVGGGLPPNTAFQSTPPVKAAT